MCICVIGDVCVCIVYVLANMFSVMLFFVRMYCLLCICVLLANMFFVCVSVMFDIMFVFVCFVMVNILLCVFV